MKPDASDSTRPHRPNPYTGSFLLVALVLAGGGLVVFALTRLI